MWSIDGLLLTRQWALGKNAKYFLIGFWSSDSNGYEELCLKRDITPVYAAIPRRRYNSSVSFPTNRLLAPQEGPCSMDLIIHRVKNKDTGRDWIHSTSTKVVRPCITCSWYCPSVTSESDCLGAQTRTFTRQTICVTFPWSRHSRTHSVNKAATALRTVWFLAGKKYLWDLRPVRLRNQVSDRYKPNRLVQWLRCRGVWLNVAWDTYQLD